MSIQWTVSFEKSELDGAGLIVLSKYEYVEFERLGKVDIDMEEGEFFAFAEEMASIGIELPEDGSNSWSKHV